MGGWEQLSSFRRMVDGVQDRRKSDLQKTAEISINEKYKLKTRKQNPRYYKGDFSGVQRLLKIRIGLDLEGNGV